MKDQRDFLKLNRTPTMEQGQTYQRCSLSRSGNVWDNAAMESSFSTLKTERTAAKVYRTQAKTSVSLVGDKAAPATARLRDPTAPLADPTTLRELHR